MKQLIVFIICLLIGISIGFIATRIEAEKNNVTHSKSDTSAVKPKLRFFAIGYQEQEIRPSKTVLQFGIIGSAFDSMPNQYDLQNLVKQTKDLTGDVAIISICELDSVDYFRFFKH